MLETAKTPIDKVRQLQRKLWVCAKQSKTRRFHALYDRIYRSDVLWEAWKRVRSNGGAAGVDKETIQAIEQRGAGEFLTEIQVALRAGRYRPSPVKRRAFIRICMASASSSRNVQRSRAAFAFKHAPVPRPGAVPSRLS